MSESLQVNVKPVKGDILSRKVELKLQGLLLQALQEMSYDRREEMAQTIRDIIEQRLVKDKYLPEWWFERKF